MDALSPTKAHVIVVDDHADNAMVLSLGLGDLGFDNIQTFNSGREMLAYLRQNPPPKVDLIFLDIQMPLEDGYVILAQVRQIPGLEETQVVALTANVMAEDLANAERAGFNHFIGKPISSERFPTQVQTICQRQRVWQAR